jgi:hypothetical protein
MGDRRNRRARFAARQLRDMWVIGARIMAMGAGAIDRGQT